MGGSFGFMTLAMPDASTLWRIIAGFPAYEVSNDGRVRRAVSNRSWPAGRELKPATADSGHLYVMLSRDGKSYKQFVHRLVCGAFNGAPPSDEACALHRDDVPTHNWPRNLYWGTRLDNHNDRMRNRGWKRNQPKGSAVGGSRLTEQDIYVIRQLRHVNRLTMQKIADRFGVHIMTISDILRGKTWAHVSGAQQ
jgi:hypothetical protein